MTVIGRLFQALPNDALSTAQGRSKRMDRVDNVQGHPTNMNPPNNPIGLEAPHCSLSMGTRECCYACATDV